MRSRIDASVLGAWLAAGWAMGGPLAAATRGASADAWPAQVAPAADEAVLDQRIAALEAASASLPPELLPAIRFEQAFVRMLARADESAWLPVMRALAAAPGAEPVPAALRDVAKAWVARVEMREIGTVLDNYYIKKVRYPGSLAEVERDLPLELKTDPWGEAWMYRTHAPAGFARETSQRYTLGPKRVPDLGTLREATVGRKPFVPPPWQVVPRQIAGRPALELRNGGAVVGLLQAGGKLDAYTLLYISDRWALLAATDQLFTIMF